MGSQFSPEKNDSPPGKAAVFMTKLPSGIGMLVFSLSKGGKSHTLIKCHRLKLKGEITTFAEAQVLYASGFFF